MRIWHVTSSRREKLLKGIGDTRHKLQCSVLQRVVACCSKSVCCIGGARRWCTAFCAACFAVYVAATYCNTLQHTATRCDTVQHTTTHCDTFRHTATHCNTVQHTETRYDKLQHTATHCDTLQHTATHCNTTYWSHTTMIWNTLQHTATHWDMLRHTATHWITTYWSHTTMMYVSRYLFITCATRAIFECNDDWRLSRHTYLLCRVVCDA